VFKDAWKDSVKVQTAYEQLMQLTMKNNDIDTYIANFDRLALAAEWELTAKGTLAHFCRGLEPKVYRCTLNRDTLPTTMDQWKDAICKEVARDRKFHNSGLPVLANNPGTPTSDNISPHARTPPLAPVTTTKSSLWMLMPLSSPPFQEPRSKSSLKKNKPNTWLKDVASIVANKDTWLDSAHIIPTPNPTLLTLLELLLPVPLRMSLLQVNQTLP
jgi:hypothetical protein